MPLNIPYDEDDEDDRDCPEGYEYDDEGCVEVDAYNDEPDDDEEDDDDY